MHSASCDIENGCEGPSSPGLHKVRAPLPRTPPQRPQRSPGLDRGEGEEGMGVSNGSSVSNGSGVPSIPNKRCWTGPAKTKIVVKGLTFRSDFDSGNLMKVSPLPERENFGMVYELWTARDCEGGPNTRRNSSWFYFGVAGGTVNQIITLRLVNLNNQSALYKHGMTPVFRHSGSPVWTRLRQKVTFEDEREPRIDPHLFPNAQTGSRPFEFGGKDVVFVSARVHPGETPSSFVFQGILRFLLDPADSRAAELRRRFVFKLVPLLNPDGVAAGHFRQDSYGNNLNRQYENPHPEQHASVYASKAVVMHHAARSTGRGRLTLYLDLHAHASTRGCFVYGNHLPSLEDQAENLLLPLLMTLYTPHFAFAACNFSLKHMSRVDSGEGGLSAEGTGRVFYGRRAGVLRSYTLECNYNTGKAMCNYIPPAHGAKARRFLVSELRSQPSYREQSLLLRRGASCASTPPLPLPPRKAPNGVTRSPSRLLSSGDVRTRPWLRTRNQENAIITTDHSNVGDPAQARRKNAWGGSNPPRHLLPIRSSRTSPSSGHRGASSREAGAGKVAAPWVRMISGDAPLPLRSRSRRRYRAVDTPPSAEGNSSSRNGSRRSVVTATVRRVTPSQAPHRTQRSVSRDSAVGKPSGQRRMLKNPSRSTDGDNGLRGRRGSTPLGRQTASRSHSRTRSRSSTRRKTKRGIIVAPCSSTPPEIPARALLLPPTKTAPTTSKIRCDWRQPELSTEPSINNDLQQRGVRRPATGLELR